MYARLRIKGTKDNFNALATVVRGSGASIIMVNERTHSLEALNLPRNTAMKLQEMGAGFTDVGTGRDITPRTSARIGS